VLKLNIRRKNLENIIKIIGENPEFFKTEITIEGRVVTEIDSRSGWVDGDTKITTNLDSFGVNNKLKQLKMINIVGLMNEYLKNLFSNCMQSGIQRPELKPNKNYGLTLGIDSENIRVIDKSGFGLFFYNVGEMYKVVFSIFNKLKDDFIADKNINNIDKEILKKVFESLSYETTTNQLLVLYSDLLESADLSKNEVKSKKVVKKGKKK